MGFRAPGSMATPDAPRSYLTDSASGGQDADLRSVAAQLGFDNGGCVEGIGGRGGEDITNTTPAGLRNVGQTLGRQVKHPLPLFHFCVWDFLRDRGIMDVMLCSQTLHTFP